MGNSAKFRKLMHDKRLIVAPGAYDAITARSIELEGFDAAYMTGAGTAASYGFPDYGLLTMTEMVARAEIIARSVAVPVIADADTGFGNELNVTRTVREYEKAGVAGLHIEDQVAPKKCGHLDGKEIVPREDFVAKIRAAVAAKRDPDFIIIARTDARAVAGLDEAVARVNEAMEAGADVAFVEALQSKSEVAAVPALVNGPCLLNIVRAGKTPDINLGEAELMGYRITILPSLLIGATIDACEAALRTLSQTLAPPSSAGAKSVSERFRRFGSDEWDAVRTRFRQTQNTE